jgi:putative FmdB family regulatory protein
MRYEYHCPACDQCEEHEHGMSEEPEILCHACGVRMERIISGGGFILKGDDWPGKGVKP